MDIVKLVECKEDPMTLILRKTDALYIVELKNARRDYAAKSFKTFVEAKDVFMKLSEWMMIGAYSQNERWDFLIHGTMK